MKDFSEIQRRFDLTRCLTAAHDSSRAKRRAVRRLVAFLLVGAGVVSAAAVNARASKLTSSGDTQAANALVFPISMTELISGERCIYEARPYLLSSTEDAQREFSRIGIFEQSSDIALFDFALPAPIRMTLPKDGGVPARIPVDVSMASTASRNLLCCVGDTEGSVVAVARTAEGASYTWASTGGSQATFAGFVAHLDRLGFVVASKNADGRTVFARVEFDSDHWIESELFQCELSARDVLCASVLRSNSGELEGVGLVTQADDEAFPSLVICDSKGKRVTDDLFLSIRIKARYRSRITIKATFAGGEPYFVIGFPSHGAGALMVVRVIGEGVPQVTVVSDPFLLPLYDDERSTSNDKPAVKERDELFEGSGNQWPFNAGLGGAFELVVDSQNTCLVVATAPDIVSSSYLFVIDATNARLRLSSLANSPASRSRVGTMMAFDTKLGVVALSSSYVLDEWHAQRRFEKVVVKKAEFTY